MSTRAVDDPGELARGARIIRAELDRLVSMDTTRQSADEHEAAA